MIQASLSPSRSRLAVRRFSAGPLDIHVSCRPGPTLELLTSTLSLYDVPWTLSPSTDVSLEVELVRDATPRAARGDYLECAGMLVDREPDGLRATTKRGAVLSGAFTDRGEAWHMTVPKRIEDDGWWPEIEDLVSLIVTAGWRRNGWIPLHGAGLARVGVGVLVCAASRGGKTTLTLAMARRGWRVVGDDKLLLRAGAADAPVAAVKHMLNVDPAVRDWFPEVGDLTSLPLYSEWSPKRRVALHDIFAESPALTMNVTHVVSLVRAPRDERLAVSPMTMPETISVLLHQTVVPTDPPTARWITSSLARLGQRASGFRLVLPEGVYEDPDALDVLEAALA